MTHFKLILFTILMAYGLPSSAKVDFEKVMRPDALEKIDWNKKDAFSVYYKALGKESLKEGDKYYYEVKGLKYPISLHKKKGKDKIERIYFRVLHEKLSFDSLKTYLKENGFTPAKDQKIGDDYTVYSNSQKKMKLKFSKATEELYSVEKWF